VDARDGAASDGRTDMRRRGKVGIALGVVTILVVGGAVVADRVALGAAQTQLSEKVRDELVAREIKTPDKPKVSITGFPFLTQVIAGKYKKITIGVKTPETDSVRFEQIDLVVEDLAADTSSILNGTGRVTAAKVTGTALMGWDAVRGALNVSGFPGVDASQMQVTVQDQVLHLRLPFMIANQRATLTADGAVVLEGESVKVRLTNVKTEGAASTPAIQHAIAQNSGQLAATVNIPELPYNIKINKVSSGAIGLTLDASARDVLLAGQ
jgi:hypothetical protein